MEKTENDVKVYFVTIPAHKYLHIRNYESIGYWDFWEKQSKIPGQDCETICGLLDSIKGKLDDMGGTDANSGSGQIMSYLYCVIITEMSPMGAISVLHRNLFLFFLFLQHSG